MLFLAAALCTAIGALVVWSGEDRAVKRWFALLCVACAAVCVGLWIEIHNRQWAFFAARWNMTAALAAVCMGLGAIRVMSRLPLSTRVVTLLGAAVAVHVATVWATSLYFTGEIIQYRWGFYVAGDPTFVVTPLLSTAIALYCLWLVGANYRRAHALDRNRAKYVFLSYIFLAACLLDYLPHFGVDLFGGSVSAICMPTFVAIYGYACLRYRLVAFRVLLGRTTAYLMTALLVVGGYLLTLDAADRWLEVSRSSAHTGAAALAVLLFAAIGQRLPRWLRRLTDAPEPDLRTVEHFSAELISLLDEGQLSERMRKICGEEFGSVQVDLLDGAELERESVAPLVAAQPVVESEVVRRAAGLDPPILRRYELLLSVTGGALALGKRYDDAMYSARAVRSLRVLANIFGIALANSRRVAALKPQPSPSRVSRRG